MKGKKESKPPATHTNALPDPAEAIPEFASEQELQSGANLVSPSELARKRSASEAAASHDNVTKRQRQEIVQNLVDPRYFTADRLSTENAKTASIQESMSDVIKQIKVHETVIRDCLDVVTQQPSQSFVASTLGDTPSFHDIVGLSKCLAVTYPHLANRVQQAKEKIKGLHTEYQSLSKDWENSRLSQLKLSQSTNRIFDSLEPLKPFIDTGVTNAYEMYFAHIYSLVGAANGPGNAADGPGPAADE